jgi:hypothetical protein
MTLSKRLAMLIIGIVLFSVATTVVVYTAYYNETETGFVGFRVVGFILLIFLTPTACVAIAISGFFPKKIRCRNTYVGTSLLLGTLLMQVHGPSSVWKINVVGFVLVFIGLLFLETPDC